jgi:hypothetical protein
MVVFHGYLKNLTGEGRGKTRELKIKAKGPLYIKTRPAYL